ncbi:MAG: hypothetical protein WBN38_18080, partial [Polyangiales bacterium]
MARVGEHGGIRTYDFCLRRERHELSITVLYGFVPGALWGFSVMPWFGWTAVVLGEYGCSHGPPDGFCMSDGFPLLT